MLRTKVVSKKVVYVVVVVVIHTRTSYYIVLAARLHWFVPCVCKLGGVVSWGPCKLGWRRKAHPGACQHPDGLIIRAVNKRSCFVVLLLIIVIRAHHFS